MSKYLKTKEGSIESAVLEAMSPAQQAAIAISKKEKEKEKSENNYIHAAKMAKEKGEKTFTIGGKQYDVEETLKTEKLVGGQKKLDKDGDGDIDGKDFAAMRKKAKKEEVEVDGESVELDEMKEPFVVVDTADGDKVVGTASNEKGAKSIISTSQLPPMKIKDKNTLKIVKVKKKQMIGQPIKEENLDEGYSAKQIKMAIGIASDKRYAGGNMSGAVDAIEKIKKGLSDHKQVAAVLKRQNESLAEKAARHISDTWKESASAKAKKEEMDPTDHVKKKGDKFCVYNADGSIAKEFDNKEDADKYAIANHDKMMATAKKEVKESVRPTLAQLAAKHISDMWSEAAKKVEGAEDDTPAYLSGKGKKESKEGETTMTGKPMNKIETKVKDKED